MASSGARRRDGSEAVGSGPGGERRGFDDGRTVALLELCVSDVDVGEGSPLRPSVEDAPPPSPPSSFRDDDEENVDCGICGLGGEARVRKGSC